jgi:translation initiation factor IF-3
MLGAEIEIEKTVNEYKKNHPNPEFKTVRLWREIEESFFSLKDIKIFNTDDDKHYVVIEIRDKGRWYESICADSFEELLESLLKNITAFDNGLHINESAVFGIHFSLDSFLDDHGLDKESMIQLKV